MTKTFEEEAKEKILNSSRLYIAHEGAHADVDKGGGIALKIMDVVYVFPWLEFARNWHSDEEFQELFDKFSNLNDNYEKEVIRSSKLEDQNIGLKSQLQQQALPVVPECVGKTVELLKKKPESSWSKLYSSLGEEGVTWLNDFQHNDERFGFGELNNKLFVLFHLAINGYQVEKPQLFYIELPNVFGLSDSTFVSKAGSGIISEFTKGKDYALKLTEQEIKSIDERYWQFAVPVETNYIKSQE